MLRACNEARRSCDRGRGTQRRVRRKRSGVRRCAARSHRDRGHRRRRHRRRCSSTCGPARSVTCSRTTLRAEHGITCGHWPQSMALSTVGGWLACRGAGQLSTRYGKIEDIVEGLDVVLADGTLVHTGGAPRAAVGPDLTQLFVGSEGTLGIIVGARLRAHRLPDGRDALGAYAFATFCRRARHDARDRAAGRDAGGDAPVRRHRGRAQLPDRRRGTYCSCSTKPTPTSSKRRGASSTRNAAGRRARSTSTLVGRWFEHRNDVSALEALISRGFVVDTMEVCGVVARAARGVHARDRRRSAASSTRWSRRRTRVTRTPTARACTSRSRAGRPRTGARSTTAPRGTPVSGRCSRPVARCRTTTASGSTATASCTMRWARDSACCSR